MIRRSHFVGTVLALTSLLVPTLLCAVPGTSMNSAEADCCQHMSVQECGTANMSACCETVLPNVAMAAAAIKKVPALPSGALVYSATAVVQLLSPDQSVHSRMERPGYSPPNLDSASQVLRI